MTSFQWSITASRKALLDKLEEIPEFGKRSKSEILELALADFILKHGNSNNPQTQMDVFQDNLAKAIPQIYAGGKEFNKFYKLIKTKQDFQALDRNLSIILDIHNKKGRENLK